MGGGGVGGEEEEVGGGCSGRTVGKERAIGGRIEISLSVSMYLLCCLFHLHTVCQRPACSSTSGFKRAAGLSLGPLPYYPMLPHLNGRQSWTSEGCPGGDKLFDFSDAFKAVLAFGMISLFFSKNVFICKIN